MLAQEARSWVSSPLGVSLLLSMFKESKENLEQFTKIHYRLREKTECATNSKVFSTPKNKQIELLKDTKLVVQVDCPRDAVSVWMKGHTDFKNVNLEKHIPTTAQLVLVNVSSFKSAWITANKDSGAVMKIYNSFGYTQDVKYEARILELPMQDHDFKLALIVPNEVDLLHTLFRRLANQGLEAAMCSIQPLFTVSSKLMAPSIQFDSEKTFQQEINQFGNVTVSHYGNTNVNEQGTRIRVLSCLYPTTSVTSSIKPDLSTTAPPFFFGLVFQDTPIFTGQFNCEQKKLLLK